MGNSNQKAASWEKHPDGREQDALVFNAYGKPDEVMVKTKVPVPVVDPEGDECLVKVHAAALNPIDKMRVLGKLKQVRPEKKFPAVIGYDVAGVIEEVGAGVKNPAFKKGAAVVARITNLRPGAICEYVAINEYQLALKPENLSFNEAASMPLAGVTALQALKKAGTKEGDTVFISGGAGGVGTLAIQIAKSLGASEIITTASPGEKTELVKKLGATKVVNYKEEKFEEIVTGVDVAFDCTNESAKMPAIMAEPKGDDTRVRQIITIAGSPTVEAIEDALGIKANVIMRTMLWMIRNTKAENGAKAKGAEWRFLFLKPNGEELQQLLKLAEEKKVVPVIDKVYTMDQSKEAALYQFTGRAKGKVVISVCSSE